MAVEDALSIADAYEKLGLNQSAWKRFEKHRQNKVGGTVSTLWSIGKICHLEIRSFALFAI